MSDDATANATLTTLLEARPPAFPEPADVMLTVVDAAQVARRRAAAWARGAATAKARDELGWSPRPPSWRRGFHLDEARSTT
jgi:hypothetical protein